MKRILINTLRNKCKIAVAIQEDQIIDCVYDNNDKSLTKSNIYLAKVLRIEPALQAAFIEYGAERAGFLPFSEIHPDYYSISTTKDEDSLGQDLSSQEEGLDPDIDQESYQYKVYQKHEIQNVIKKGQVLVVQVIRDERGNKGAALTTYLSIAGRYAVLMPNSKPRIGISKKIQDLEYRKNLDNLFFNLMSTQEEAMGIVIRTNAINAKLDVMKKDYEYLINTWKEIKKHIQNPKIPSLIYQEIDIIKQLIRDNYHEGEKIITTDKILYKDLTSMMEKMNVSKNSVELYQNKIPLLKKYNVLSRLNSLLSTRVELSSGAYLIINQMEALTAIDINSGKATTEKNIEEMATAINLEAAIEVANQLRLRNIGGLIVVDFIDMMQLKHKKQIEQEMKEALILDRAKVQILRLSQFGLMEISRQRIQASLEEVVTEQCPTCETGRIKSFPFLADEILDNLIYLLENNKKNLQYVEINANMNVINFLNDKYKEFLLEIEKDYNLKILFQKDISSLKFDDYKIKSAIEKKGSLTLEDLFHSKQKNIASKIKEKIVKSLKKIIRHIEK
jgi:ribonuclease E